MKRLSARRRQTFIYSAAKPETRKVIKYTRNAHASQAPPTRSPSVLNPLKPQPTTLKRRQFNFVPCLYLVNHVCMVAFAQSQLGID